MDKKSSIGTEHKVTSGSSSHIALVTALLVCLTIPAQSPSLAQNPDEKKGPSATSILTDEAFTLHPNNWDADRTGFVAEAASEHDRQASDPAVLARVPMRVLADGPYID